MMINTDEITKLAREIKIKDTLLYTWESALIEAKRVLENREKFKEVESYYQNRCKHY
ncbi:hypothetical protein [Niallia sp. FSL K6-0077]|uniref:hypothetical protein n=1 Tax=Niallia sp. FSL K6-0077 TaxID=2954743 RepID=UPI0030FCF429